MYNRSSEFDSLSLSSLSLYLPSGRGGEVVSQGTQGLVAMGYGVLDLFLHLSIGELEPLRLE